jgi:hypothetical protein
MPVKYVPLTRNMSLTIREQCPPGKMWYPYPQPECYTPEEVSKTAQGSFGTEDTIKGSKYYWKNDPSYGWADQVKRKRHQDQPSPAGNYEPATPHGSDNSREWTTEGDC